MVEDVKAAQPSFRFPTTVGGYRADLEGGRSVALYLGDDETGVRRWAVILTNQGHETKFGMSDEAMEALMSLYCGLCALEVGAVEAPRPSTDTGVA